MEKRRIVTYKLFKHTLVESTFGFSASAIFLKWHYEQLVEDTCTGDPTWLFHSRQFQCLSNSARQFSRILVILGGQVRTWRREHTETLISSYSEQ